MEANLANFASKLYKINEEFKGLLHEIDPQQQAAPSSINTTEMDSIFARRLRVNRDHILMEMEQQSMAIAIITMACVLSAFWVFYKLVEQLIRRGQQQQCTCTSSAEWLAVVSAARRILTVPLAPEAPTPPQSE